ncbi:MAG: hypothetical protein LBU28_03695 [Spirochaetaceae bacterium]|jgi:hypothetical protein|nr:hypothetical protein [Spirochaetaceae bacterium]
MDIAINGKPADITLETETTLGEILGGIAQWMRGSGHLLSGLRLDGELIGSASMGDVFSRELAGIRSIDILTSTRGELMAEALIAAGDFLKAYGEAPFTGQGRIREEWEKTPASGFLAGEDPDLAGGLAQTFRGNGLPLPQWEALIGERLRELADPLEEAVTMEQAVSGIARRLEDLPLDIQTGKDARAAETVSLFSALTEKIFRLICLFRERGLLSEPPASEGPSADEPAEAFTLALRELLAAYEAKDAVLVGDLAEYELAPRLLRLYAVLNSTRKILKEEE